MANCVEIPRVVKKKETTTVTNRNVNDLFWISAIFDFSLHSFLAVLPESSASASISMASIIRELRRLFALTSCPATLTRLPR